MAPEVKLDDSTPLYEQVRRAVEALIDSGDLSPGDRLPSEPDLCRRFGVSRITARRAMNELARMGLVIRRSGLGTFVAPKGARRGPYGPGPAAFLYAPRAGGQLPEELAPLAGELSWAAPERGMLLLAAPPGGDWAAALERMRAICPSGVVMAPGVTPPEGLGQILSAVAVDPAKRGLVRSEIILDRVAAGREAAHYLIRLGHRALGFVGCAAPEGGPAPDDARAADHLRGFAEALELSGLTLSSERCADAADKDAIAGIVAGPRRASGVVCLDDRSAANTVAIARSEGVRVPEELSVIGHGGARSREQAMPVLSTVAYDWKEIASAAVELLTRAGDGPVAESFTGTIEVHQTSARIAAGGRE